MAASIMNYSTTKFAAFDPYDLWATQVGLDAKKQFIQGEVSGKLKVISIAFADWLFPQLSRTVAKVETVMTPILIAHQIEREMIDGKIDKGMAKAWLNLLSDCAIKSKKGGYSWGLGFPWMDRRGFYDVDIPFITHTPYVMESLVELAAQCEEVGYETMNMFFGTWCFLESLYPLYEDDTSLAISYAPLPDEGLIVVNASAYASFAYALHGKYGENKNKKTACKKMTKLTNWVINQQKPNGSWTYLAGDVEQNFIDCFHSCFVIKNLIKINQLHLDVIPSLDFTIEKGWGYLNETFVDQESGLCRRFTVNKRNFTDPYRWDLYDQAEYLGLLVDFGMLTAAVEFSERVERKFKKGNDWYCRIDIFGRRWGKGFLRWGIAPFWYHQARLKQALNDKE